MTLDDVILQIRHHVPMFGSRVAGAAEFAAAFEKSAMAMTMPCAYVVPAADEPGDNASENGLWQTITEAFTVFVFVDNRADRRGQNAISLSTSSIRAAIFTGILNWRLDPEHAAKGLRYLGGNLAKADTAVLVYGFDFAHEITVTQDDGWQEPSDPLETLQLNIVSNEPTETPITERMILIRADIDLEP